MGKTEVVCEPGDPLELNQREFDILALAFPPDVDVEWTALRSAVETILNERLVNKFRIEIEPVNGVRWIKVWHDETLFFAGREDKQPAGQPARKKGQKQ